MAVAVISTDTWIERLLFTGRRQTEMGPADGLFFGTLAGTGDASGGNLTLNGLISEQRKEDWVYQIKGLSASINAIAAQEAFIVAATGPLIPTGTTVANPSFHLSGGMNAIPNNAVTTFGLNSGSGGKDIFTDLLVFGDKKIAGTLGLIAMGFETNTNLAIFQLSIWGFLFRYSSFFRNVSPSVG